MSTWSPHLYRKHASETDLSKSAIDNLVRIGESLARKQLPIIFSLKHLATLAKVEFSVLDNTVRRQREAANYRMYAVAKRSGGRRFIHSVCRPLFETQQFINRALLRNLKPHSSSFAFSPDGGIRECAARHCGAQWMLQVDLKDFFFHINERDVWEIFSNAGYPELLSFQMSRICTTTRLPTHLEKHTKSIRRIWNNNYVAYRHPKIGVLPQGAPTSPILSNVVVCGLD